MLSANIRRFTVEDYHWLTEKGFFAEDDRVIGLVNIFPPVERS